MSRLILAVLLVLGQPAQARDWTTAEKVWAGTALALTAVDYLQTMTIARNPQRWYETNPLLGRHPSPGQVTLHFLGSIALTGTIMHFFPESRLPLAVGFTVMEGAMVTRNHRLGISISGAF